MITSGSSQLSKIRWSSGEVDFIANTDRADFESGGKMLNEIVLKNVNQVQIKDFKFNYDYLQQRYFLNSLVESGVDQSVQLKHSFEYISAASLPVRTMALAQDHWGYYNGANTNTHLLPPTPNFNNSSLNANREPDGSYMQYGTLSKITYPTGGYTIFQYEANRYDPASPVGGGNPYNQLYTNTLTVKAGSPQPSGFVTSQTFNVPITQNTATINIQFTNYNKPASPKSAYLPLVKIEKLVNGIYQQVYYWDAFNNFPVGNVTPNQNGLVDFSINQNLSFEPGDYRITADIPCGIQNCGTPPVMPQSAAALTYTASNGQLPIAGGLRIKQMTNYNAGSFASSKTYTYGPGKLLIYPKYVYQYAEDVSIYRACNNDQNGCGPCTQLWYNYRAVSSSSQAILGVTQGAIVGYTYVKEQDVDAAGNDNGFTDYSFDFTPDGSNIIIYDNTYWSGLLNSSIPLNNLDYKRGALLNKNTYKKSSDGTYIMLHSLVNNYSYNDNDSTKRYNSLQGLRVNYIKRSSIYCGNINGAYSVPSSYPFSPDFTYGFYNIITGWVQNVSTVETTYDSQGQNPFVKTTTNVYGNPDHLQITSSSTNDSKGNIILTELKYPADFAVAAPGTPNVYNDMVAKNMIAGVIEQKNSLNTAATPLSDTKTDYGYFAGNTIIKPAIVSSSVKGNALEQRIIFNNYDGKGNILDQSKLNDEHQVYLWGYNGAYPVAKIVNSNFDKASEWANPVILDNANGTYTDQQMRDELNKIRTGLANVKALVTTYTYAPLIGLTSETDPAGKTTYYEYDGFNRLKNMKDYQGNIVKNFQYNYASSCGANCVVLPMQTFNGSNTISYPVGVFNINGQLLGNATSQAQYLSLWNSDATNTAKGVLSAGIDSMHFNLSLATSQTAPPAVTGLRYYQFDLPYTQFDGAIYRNSDYIDFGDGTSMRLPGNNLDVPAVLPANTVAMWYPNMSTVNPAAPYPYFVHNYPNNNTKTLTMYHSDDTKTCSPDNALQPATSLTKVKNLRGNIPQFMDLLGGSSIQEPTFFSVANITNWNSITNIKNFNFNRGDGVTVCKNVNYAQDFMANNKGLTNIYFSDNSPYASQMRDTTFKISRLKSDWNTWFTALKVISISDEQWNRENLSGLPNLTAFVLTATNQNHSNDPTNNPVIPLPPAVIDNVIIQIAAGSGQTVSNGVIYISSPGSDRTSNSNTAISQLKAKGWTITINGTNL